MNAGMEDLEEDILERIVVLLPVREICTLGACSRSLRRICSQNELWCRLFLRRWPEPTLAHVHSRGNPPSEGWRTAYSRLHLERSRRAKAVIEFVKTCAREESLEVANYLRAMELLCTMRGLGFQDILTNLLLPRLSVLVNLIGLHYSLSHLGVQEAAVREALVSSHISDRHICIRWWSLGGWSNGFRQRDEMHMKISSLYDLTQPHHHFLFRVMERGIVHEVLRVQISADFKTSAWVWRDMHSQR